MPKEKIYTPRVRRALPHERTAFNRVAKSEVVTRLPTENPANSPPLRKKRRRRTPDGLRRLSSCRVLVCKKDVSSNKQDNDKNTLPGPCTPYSNTRRRSCSISSDDSKEEKRNESQASSPPSLTLREFVKPKAKYRNSEENTRQLHSIDTSAWRRQSDPLPLLRRPQKIIPTFLGNPGCDLIGKKYKKNSKKKLKRKDTETTNKNTDNNNSLIQFNDLNILETTTNIEDDFSNENNNKLEFPTYKTSHSLSELISKNTSESFQNHNNSSFTIFASPQSPSLANSSNSSNPENQIPKKSSNKKKKKKSSNKKIRQKKQRKKRSRSNTTTPTKKIVDPKLFASPSISPSRSSISDSNSSTSINNNTRKRKRTRSKGEDNRKQTRIKAKKRTQNDNNLAKSKISNHNLSKPKRKKKKLNSVEAIKAPTTTNSSRRPQIITPIFLGPCPGDSIANNSNNSIINKKKKFFSKSNTLTITKQSPNSNFTSPVSCNEEKKNSFFTFDQVDPIQMISLEEFKDESYGSTNLLTPKKQTKNCRPKRKSLDISFVHPNGSKSNPSFPTPTSKKYKCWFTSMLEIVPTTD